MESGSTSCRRLNFEANEECQDDGVKVINEGLNNKIDLENIEAPISEDFLPSIGQEFESEEDAYQFYLTYARRIGFSIRKSRCHINKSGEMLDRVLFCSAQGKKEIDKRRDLYVKNKRAETRFGCEAKMKISRRSNGKLCVVQFVREHNHYLTSPNKTHFLRSHRKISSSAAIQIEMASEVGIPQKACHDLMARQVGGREFLGFIPKDYKNYLRSKRTRNVMVGDSGGVLEYLQKQQLQDPNFFYAIQLDEDDLITNIYWSDAKMRADYGHFGDVICFDTTYRKNNEGRPIALFVGVNHHKQSIIFGVSLLYDETSMSFEWLFDTFSKAMREKKPITILTDQDASMAKALTLKWPETHHRLCIWHIYQNAAIHLSGVFSQFKGFAKDFASCIYDFDEERDFITAWNQMLTQYSLEENDWLRRMFQLREKWALVYGRHIFCADMTTTQRSESMNSIVKRYVTYKHKFLDFFNHFERLLEDRRYEELKAETRSKVSAPFLEFPIEILKQASSIYTPEIYKCFQTEWCKSHDTSVRIIENDGTLTKYEINPLRKSYNNHIVIVDLSCGKFECDCKKIDFTGILCSHILKIFTINNIVKIPNKFIRKRWTREAKVGYFEVNESTSDQTSLSTKVLQSMRYQELCGLYVQLVTKAAERNDTYKVAKDDILRTLKSMDEMLQVGESNATNILKEVEISVRDSHGIKGIKRKEKTMSGKRLKGALERMSKRRKRSSKTKQTSTLENVRPHSMHGTQSLQPLPTQHSQSIFVSTGQHLLAESSQSSMRWDAYGFAVRPQHVQRYREYATIYKVFLFFSS
ncbi:protein FAR1-RELATED SEQUENCE 5-like [Impatiens glandulifera]|uniref:protein FAR1-RELATED SEQUENCE 5-like n=1 Tax=Impatiens glandulifera TaxID=253017 RepID=UPI001FB151AE|nr:protein FAR1-RELATED SEQUENCE 5-like [Impatiens glandulifera]